MGRNTYPSYCGLLSWLLRCDEKDKEVIGQSRNEQIHVELNKLCVSLYELAFSLEEGSTVRTKIRDSIKSLEEAIEFIRQRRE